jgi:pyruvate formate lyase activating enzyme
VNGRRDVGAVEGLIFDVDTFAVHDGPGIRMAVYMKGCPLSCLWCHSPESLRPAAELIYLASRCVLCGECARICPNGVHAVNASGHSVNLRACRLCRNCIANCAAGALQVKGYVASAQAIVDKASRLKPFFDHSGGGITLTGGEVTMQADFAAAVLVGCKARGIHTAVETCGACRWQRLEKVLRHADLVLYDLKLISDQQHRRWTGASNRQILRNARRLSERTVEVRVPLIPGITDTEENLGGIFRFLRDAGLPRVTLLPYNPSSGAKYEWLCMPYGIEGETQKDERLAELQAVAEELGLEARVSS